MHGKKTDGGAAGGADGGATESGSANPAKHIVTDIVARRIRAERHGPISSNLVKRAGRRLRAALTRSGRRVPVSSLAPSKAICRAREPAVLQRAAIESRPSRREIRELIDGRRRCAPLPSRGSLTAPCRNGSKKKTRRIQKRKSIARQTRVAPLKWKKVKGALHRKVALAISRSA